jgi:lipid-A-disaccharide synthase
LRFLLIAHSVVLPNLILGENFFPELLNKDCNSEALSQALLPLMRGGPERDEQLTAVASVVECVRESDQAPSVKAAGIVLAYAQGREAKPSEAQRDSTGT